jgi:hypothetical protein
LPVSYLFVYVARWKGVKDHVRVSEGKSGVSIILTPFQVVELKELGEHGTVVYISKLE